MSDIIQRFTNLLSANSGTIGTTPGQISGGPPANWPLTTVSAAFYPSYRRAAVRVTNTHATQTLYVGPNGSIVPGPGGGWAYELGPGQSTPYEPLSGSVPLWLVGSAAGTSWLLEEFN
jgi:hypothetical protein